MKTLKIYRTKDIVPNTGWIKPGMLFFICKNMDDPRLVPVKSTNGLGISLEIIGDLDKFFEIVDEKPIDYFPYISICLQELKDNLEDAQRELTEFEKQLEIKES